MPSFPFENPFPCKENGIGVCVELERAMCCWNFVLPVSPDVRDARRNSESSLRKRGRGTTSDAHGHVCRLLSHVAYLHVIGS